ncbi:MAG: hypothetical protein ACI4TB_05375, partial [Lachnospiraceae bacterium]
RKREIFIKEGQGMDMKKTGSFVAVTIFLVLLSAFFITGTVKSQSKEEMKLSEEYFHQLEKEYVKEMREYLNEAGFTDSGVMLTRTVFEDGSREYQVAIHNSRFDSLAEAERMNLIQELEKKVFKEENCSFAYYLTGNA